MNGSDLGFYQDLIKNRIGAKIGATDRAWPANLLMMWYCSIPVLLRTNLFAPLLGDSPSEAVKADAKYESLG